MIRIAESSEGTGYPEDAILACRWMASHYLKREFAIVAELREQGWSWARIAEVTGHKSKQAALKYYEPWKSDCVTPPLWARQRPPHRTTFE